MMILVAADAVGAVATAMVAGASRASGGSSRSGRVMIGDRGFGSSGSRGGCYSGPVTALDTTTAAVAEMAYEVPAKAMVAETVAAAAVVL